MMVNKTVSYAEFKRLLEQFGFQVHKTPDPYWVFENRAFDAILTLPFMMAAEPIRPAHLLTARMLLAYKGIADENDFDQALDACLQLEDAVPVASA
jgi:hypothetical protein